MAKRASAEEETYRPLLDRNAISAALAATPPSSTSEPNKSFSTVGSELNRSGVVAIPPESRRAAGEAQSLRASFQQPSRQALVLEVVEKLDHERRLLLTRAESESLDRLVSSLASRVNTQVKPSHVLRALLALLQHAEGEIDRKARDTVGLSRPANGDFKGLQRFEREIAKIIAASLRDAGPLRE